MGNKFVMTMPCQIGYFLRLVFDQALNVHVCRLTFTLFPCIACYKREEIYLYEKDSHCIISAMMTSLSGLASMIWVVYRQLTMLCYIVY